MNAPGAIAEDYDEDETSVAGLWETARWFMRWLLAVCGVPAEVAALNLLARRERSDILRWLRPVEALARRLLIAEAARVAENLHSENRGKSRAGRRGARPARRPAVPQDAEHPEQWTARFALSPGGGRRRAVRRRRPGNRWRIPRRPVGRCDNHFERIRRMLERDWKKANPARGRNRDGAAALPAPPPLPAGQRKPAALFDAFPLARRIEALRRVLDDREPHVKRLARRLARRRGGDIARLRRACRPPPERSPHAVNRYGEKPIRHASAHALQALSAFDTS